MKTTRISTKESGPTRSNQDGTPKNSLSRESISLDPETISERVTTKTTVLNEILDGDEGRYHVRHWGINE